MISANRRHGFARRLRCDFFLRVFIFDMVVDFYCLERAEDGAPLASNAPGAHAGGNSGLAAQAGTGAPVPRQF